MVLVSVRVLPSSPLAILFRRSLSISIVFLLIKRFLREEASLYSKTMRGIRQVSEPQGSYTCLYEDALIKSGFQASCINLFQALNLISCAISIMIGVFLL